MQEARGALTCQQCDSYDVAIVPKQSHIIYVSCADCGHVGAAQVSSYEGYNDI